MRILNAFETVCLITACFVVFSANTAGAQATTATLSGTVVDESGAVVPDVVVMIENLGTALRRQTRTTSDGGFSVPLLTPGRYLVTAQRDGFTPIEVPDVILNVGDQVNLTLRLKIAAVGQEVTVVAEPARVSTSPAVSTVIDRRFVENMPLNGRSFQALLALTPGVVSTRADALQPGQFSVNGQRTNANYFTIDGVSANVGVSSGSAVTTFFGGSRPALSSLGSTQSLVSVDALQEFAVQTSSFAPEFGRSPGAQISMLTRSGTNVFHGSAFNYFRNDALDANDWFANARGLKKPPLRQNDFGGVLGGPVLRSQLFFFVSHESLRLKLPQATISEVPSMALRRDASASIQPILMAYPLPNGRDFGNGLAEFSASFSQSAKLDSSALRLDHNWNDRLSTFARVSVAPSKSVNRGAANRALSVLSHTSVDTNFATVGVKWVGNSALFNDFKFNYSSAVEDSVLEADSFGGAQPPTTQSLFPIPRSLDDSIFLSTVISTRGFFTVGRLSNNRQAQFNLVNTVGALVKNHQLKFGVDFRRLLPVYDPTNYFLQISFSTAASVSTAIAPSAIVIGRSSARLSYVNLSAFAQDSWLVSPRLTLTYGVRWEVNPAPEARETAGLVSVVPVDDPSRWTLSSSGASAWKTPYGSVAPRFGVVYQLRPDPRFGTVVRGGAGIFYDMGNAVDQLGSSYPYVTSRSLSNVLVPLDASVAVPPAAGPPYFVYVYDSDQKLPYSMQWNATIEQFMGRANSVIVSYVGALGRRLQRQLVIRNPNPEFSGGGIFSNSGSSEYHGLQIQFTRRLSDGVQAMTSYSFGKSEDDVSSESVDLDQDRGPSSFDVRHTFTGAVSYALPHPSGPLAGLLGGWSVDTLFRAQSGWPINVMALPLTRFDGIDTRVRPDIVPGVSPWIDDPNAPGGKRLNRLAFATPPVGRQGTLPRNAFRGFPWWQVDLAIRRHMTLTGRFGLQIRAEAFNVLNNPNFGDPVTDLRSSLFGESTSMLNRGFGVGEVGFSPLYQVGGPRSIQLSLKLLY